MQILKKESSNHAEFIQMRDFLYNKIPFGLMNDIFTKKRLSSFLIDGNVEEIFKDNLDLLNGWNIILGKSMTGYSVSETDNPEELLQTWGTPDEDNKGHLSHVEERAKEINEVLNIKTEGDKVREEAENTLIIGKKETDVVDIISNVSGIPKEMLEPNPKDEKELFPDPEPYFEKLEKKDNKPKEVISNIHYVTQSEIETGRYPKTFLAIWPTFLKEYKSKLGENDNYRLEIKLTSD